MAETRLTLRTLDMSLYGLSHIHSCLGNNFNMLPLECRRWRKEPDLVRGLAIFLAWLSNEGCMFLSEACCSKFFGSVLRICDVVSLGDDGDLHLSEGLGVENIRRASLPSCGLFDRTGEFCVIACSQAGLELLMVAGLRTDLD